jgi:hypothetical protein
MDWTLPSYDDALGSLNPHLSKHDDDFSSGSLLSPYPSRAKNHKLVLPHSNSWHRSGWQDMIVYDMLPPPLIRPDRTFFKKQHQRTNKLSYSVEISCKRLTLFGGNGLKQRGASPDPNSYPIIEAQQAGLFSTTTTYTDCETHQVTQMYRATAKSGVEPDGIWSR